MNIQANLAYALPTIVALIISAPGCTKESTGPDGSSSGVAGQGGAGGSSSGAGGVGTGGSQGGSGGAGVVAVEVDGVAMTVTEVTLWPAGQVDGNTHLFLAFSGPGFSGEDDVAIDVVAAGAGCDQGNAVWLRPDVDNTAYPDQYLSDSTAGCGMQVSSVPAAVGESLVGSFDGTLDALQSATTPSQAQVVVTFDVLRE